MLDELLDRLGRTCKICGVGEFRVYGEHSDHKELSSQLTIGDCNTCGEKEIALCDKGFCLDYIHGHGCVIDEFLEKRNVMPCMCGDTACGSCGPAQGAGDSEHLALCDRIEALYDAYEEDAVEKIADLVIETREKERKHLINGFEVLLTRIIGAKRAKHYCNLVRSDDFDEEFERWMDRKYPRKKR